MKNIIPLILIITSFCIGCSRDVSNDIPYKTAIGKSFILQEDVYIYSYLDSPRLVLGSPIGILPYVNGHAPTVDAKFIGLKTNQIIIRGIAKKESILSIKEISIHKDVDNTYPDYIANIKGEEKQYLHMSSELLDLQKNPPFTTTWRNKDAPPVPIWSDPPIFKAKYALPLPSDGIWWK